MRKKLIVIVAGCALLLMAGGFAVDSIRDIRAELRELRADLAGLPQGSSSAPTRPARNARVLLPPNQNLDARVAALEAAVEQLARASDYLMERGQIPLAANKIKDLLARLADGRASDGERLRALRLLRRNQALSDEALQHAVSWLQNATNANIRREVLQQLDGTTNMFLKTPLLSMLGQEGDNEVREELIDNLRHFVGDPSVESALWNSMLNDPDEEVREEAEEALREGPMSPARLNALRERALDPQSTLDERLVALRALHNAEAPAADVISTLAALAQTTQDPVERAKLFRAFDDANDPAFVLPLVQGLQDPNSVVRQEAVDALGDHVSRDPAIRQWLEYVSKNDPDPRVQREAFGILRRLNR